MPLPSIFLLFVAVPIVEIYILIQVGTEIGALTTVGLIVATAAAGSWMLRAQGLSTWARARAALDAGQLPAMEILEGLLLLIGGVLLLTPGFVTDGAGLLLLVPPSRRRLAARIASRIQARGEGPRQEAPQVIEGEWRREDDA